MQSFNWTVCSNIKYLDSWESIILCPYVRGYILKQENKLLIEIQVLSLGQTCWLVELQKESLELQKYPKPDNQEPRKRRNTKPEKF